MGHSCVARAGGLHAPGSGGRAEPFGNAAIVVA